LARIGILTALLPEAACLIRRPGLQTLIRLSDEVSLFVSGAGAARARRGTECLLANGAEYLLSLGTAGALAVELNAGDVVVPDRVILDSGHHETDVAWRTAVIRGLSARGVPVHVGGLLDATEVIRNSEDKRALHRSTGAIAADMESAAVLEAAAAAGVPSLVMRVIVDPADLSIPDFILAQSDAYGRARIGGILLSLLQRPDQLPRLLRLARGYRAATGRLRQLGQDPAAMKPLR
jgi:hopanoid-associated phosphorylase